MRRYQLPCVLVFPREETEMSKGQEKKNRSQLDKGLPSIRERHQVRDMVGRRGTTWHQKSHSVERSSWVTWLALSASGQCTSPPAPEHFLGICQLLGRPRRMQAQQCCVQQHTELSWAVCVQELPPNGGQECRGTLLETLVAMQPAASHTPPSFHRWAAGHSKQCRQAAGTKNHPSVRFICRHYATWRALVPLGVTVHR